jgi:hypothetical protein
MNEKERHITPIGGLKIDADHPVSAQVSLVSLVGGIKADLTAASLPEAGTITLTKYSLVGGVNLTVPEGVEVEVEGFTLFPPLRPVDPPATPDGRKVKVTAYGVFGGVRVVRG